MKLNWKKRAGRVRVDREIEDVGEDEDRVVFEIRLKQLRCWSLGGSTNDAPPAMAELDIILRLYTLVIEV
jgi:hypothetical protein